MTTFRRSSNSNSIFYLGKITSKQNSQEITNTQDSILSSQSMFVPSQTSYEAAIIVMRLGQAKVFPEPK